MQGRTNSRDTVIAIAGAGPVGLAAALAIRRQGLQVRIFDRLNGPCRESRALTIQPRTLEVLEPLGVVPEMIVAGQPVRQVNYYLGGRRCFRLDLVHIPSVYPFVLQLPQYRIEAIFTSELRKTGVEVERGMTLTDVTQDSETVRLKCNERDAGTFTWLLGCDGARSAVRQACAIAFEDVPYSTAFIMGDVTIPDFPLNPDERHTFFGKTTYFVVMPSGDRFFRIVAIRLPGMRAAGDPSLEEFSHMLAICNGPRMTFADARCLTHFYPRRAVAERLRRGRVFLAGDAAHIHPPVGALGLNTGVQDALNLAWKLAYVCRGLAGDRLLESYHTERHSVAQRLVRDTDESTRRIIEASWSGRLRERIRWLAHCLPPLQIRMAMRNTQLGVTYHREQNGLTSAVPGLFTGRVRTGDRAPLIRLPKAGGGPLPFQLLVFSGSARGSDLGGKGRSSLVRLAGWARSFARPMLTTSIVGRTGDADLPDFDGRIHRSYGVKRPAMVLVRPDGHVAALLPTEKSTVAAALVEAIPGLAISDSDCRYESV